MASLSKSPRPLINAKRDYKFYLLTEEPADHYLTVSRKEAPLRRVDGERVTKLPQLARIKIDFKWDDDQERWTLKDGRRIVTEDEIYDVILSFQRVYEGSQKSRLFYHISERLEGIQRKDVEKAVELWTKHNLELLAAWDDDLWGGPAAVYVPGQVIEPLGEPIASVSAPTTSSSSPKANNPLYSTPDTDISSGSHIKDSYFHPYKDDCLHVGTCGRDGSDVWMTLSIRTGSQQGVFQPVFYDEDLIIKTRDALNIAWHEDYDIDNFPGAGKKQKRLQYEHLYRIIEEQKDKKPFQFYSAGRDLIGGAHAHTVDLPLNAGVDALRHTNTLQELSNSDRNIAKSMHEKPQKQERPTLIVNLPVSKPASRKRPRPTPVVEIESSSEEEREALRPAKRAMTDIVSIRSSSPERVPKIEPSDNKSEPSIGNLSSQAVLRTSLLVSASNQPARAPANVPLEDCSTQAQLFETLVLECNLKGKVAAESSEVSATYTWSQKQHLIRKGRPRDWNIFCEDIKKAWDKEASKFAEDGCEIKMMVHVNG